MKDTIIWTSEIDLKDYKDFFEEIGLTDESEQYQEASEQNNMYLEDLRISFDKNIPENYKIIAVADLGFWDGRCLGVKNFQRNLYNCLFTDKDIIDVEWAIRDGDFVSTQKHHDNTNYITYRAVPDRYVDKLCEKIEKGLDISEIWDNHAKKLAPEIEEVLDI